MARAGMPDDTTRFPECGETLHYNAATRCYHHVLAIVCPKKRAS